jgi:hypothetical protein
VLLGSMVIAGKYNHVTPFHKRLHSALYTTTTIEDFKTALLEIDPSCPELDPSQIVLHYRDPWWTTPSLDREFLNLLDGTEEFISQVYFLRPL